MKSTIKILCIIVFFILSFIIFYSYKEGYNKYNNSNLFPPDTSSVTPDVSHSLEIALKQMIAYEEFQIDSTWILKDNVHILLKDYIKEWPILILFYPQHFCGECFYGDAMRFNDISSHYIEKTLLISTDLSKRDLLFLKKEYNIKAETLPVYTKQDVLFKEMKEPCCFILNKDMKVHLFFNPDPDLPELSDWYFKKISSLLNKLEK